jgi:hypothetical protein
MPLPLFEIARALVRFDRVASVIVNGWAAAEKSSSVTHLDRDLTNAPI